MTDSRVRAPHQLHESEARYRMLVEACPEPIVVHAGGRIRFVNPAALALLGAAQESDVVGRPVMDFVHPDFRAVVVERMRKMLETGAAALLLEEKIVRLDGAVREVEIAGAPVLFEGEPAIQLVGRDLTEQRRAEAEHRRLEERVREARRRESLFRLAEGVAHELQRLSEQLLETVDESVASGRPIGGRQLGTIRRVGQRMGELTDRLQGYVGKRPPAGVPVDLSALVLELSETLETEVGVETLGFDLPVELPRVRADATQLRRILRVLIHNAVDAMGGHAGSIAVRTRALALDAAALATFQPAESLEPGDYVALEVHDTGCGMDDATRAQVLDPFFSTKSPGRGLGLSEVLGLVRGAGGGIRVASAPGRSTTVTLVFPALPPEVSPGRRTRKPRD